MQGNGGCSVTTQAHQVDIIRFGFTFHSHESALDHGVHANVLHLLLKTLTNEVHNFYISLCLS